LTNHKIEWLENQRIFRDQSLNISPYEKLTRKSVTGDGPPFSFQGVAKTHRHGNVW